MILLCLCNAVPLTPWFSAVPTHHPAYCDDWSDIFWCHNWSSAPQGPAKSGLEIPLRVLFPRGRWAGKHAGAELLWIHWCIVVMYTVGCRFYIVCGTVEPVLTGALPYTALVKVFSNVWWIGLDDLCRHLNLINPKQSMTYICHWQEVSHRHSNIFKMAVKIVFF